jgi:hypothetical protein
MRCVPDKKNVSSALNVENIEIINQSFVNPTLLALQEDLKTLIQHGHTYITAIH